MSIDNEIREMILGMTDSPEGAESFEQFHDSRWDNRLNRDAALRDYIIDELEETHCQAKQDTYIWQIVVRVFWGADWAKHGDCVHDIIEDYYESGELTRPDSDDDPDPDDDPDDVESAAIFFDRWIGTYKKHGFDFDDKTTYHGFTVGDRVSLLLASGTHDPYFPTGTIGAFKDAGNQVIVLLANNQDKPCFYAKFRWDDDRSQYLEVTNSTLRSSYLVKES